MIRHGLFDQTASLITTFIIPMLDFAVDKKEADSGEILW
jgi:hypothetical protein